MKDVRCSPLAVLTRDVLTFIEDINKDGREQEEARVMNEWSAERLLHI